MRRIRDELLEEIARLELSLQEARSRLEPESSPESRSESLLDEHKIRRILVARRIRERLLGADLFADPAWDLLLAALAADLGRKPADLSDLCQTWNIPSSVAERWIRKLEKDGWLNLSGTDREPWQIELTPEGAARLRRYFDMVGPTFLLL